MTEVYGQLNTGQVAMTGSAVQLTASADDIGGIVVKAHDANPGKVYVGGGSGVLTTTGFELGAGQAVSLALNTQSIVYAIGASGNSVSWAAVSPV